MRKQNKTFILEYLNLDLKKIPKTIINSDNIDIKSTEIKNEKNYKVYKYLPIKDIEILITNTRRLDEASKKIENMNDLSFYLNKKNEEEYEAFLNLLQNASVQDIQEIEDLQQEFKNNIPVKVKYQKDYLWQIYYIKRTNKYYMLVPMQEMEHQAFLYVLKKKNEKSEEKIYVPICNVDYDNEFIEKSKINTLENNLFFFTNKWPMIYEVYNQNEELSINIIGQVDIYENIESDYKLHFEDKNKLKDFYNLIKTLFYIQTELTNYFIFNMVLDKTGYMHFYYKDNEITNDKLHKFYSEEIKRNTKNIEEIENIQIALTKKLNKLKSKERKLNSELLEKQKQISTFLECKKTFFGRVKYFFKYGKKKNDKVEENYIEEDTEVEDAGTIKPSYCEDLEDLIYVCKELKTKTTIAATTRLDIQNLTVKIEVLKKKIENASLYIKEIESHKKSIFEFWKFTNKDEKNQLAEGVEQVEKETKIEKNFNIKEDLVEFSKYIDREARKLLTEVEQDNILVAVTNVLDDINLITNKERITTENLQKLKEDEKLIKIDENVLVHREKLKNIKNIIGITEDLTLEEYTTKLKSVIKNIEKAFKKTKINMSIPLYLTKEPKKELTKLQINPQKLISNNRKVDLYKLNFKNGSNLLGFSNIIFFSNRNKTLPLGMDYSTCMLADLRKVEFIKIKTTTNYIIKLEDNSLEEVITKINITEINV
ncbi:MAG: hypothetical protein E7314_04670 [Clostridiales bacterium]|nr:hypothetical protein [Clostridiales bacterium]